MERTAAPMVGGLVTSFALELFVYPTVYELWKRRRLTSTEGSVTRHERNRPSSSPTELRLALRAFAVAQRAVLLGTVRPSSEID